MFGVLTTHIANNILIKVVPYIYMSTQTSQSINEKRTVHSKDSTDDMDLFFLRFFRLFCQRAQTQIQNANKTK